MSLGPALSNPCASVVSLAVLHAVWRVGSLAPAALLSWLKGRQAGGGSRLPEQPCLHGGS